MDYDALDHFITKKMRMTHIYQPLMIRTILESADNTSTAEEIAASFVGQDRSYLEYYTRIVKKWPHKTLVGQHKVLQYDRRVGSYTLSARGLTDAQKDRLIQKCNDRLADFLGKDYWILGRRMNAERISIEGSRYDVFAKSKGRCVACGASAQDIEMDIDHIVPRSRGGSDALDNLQALCYKCNRDKRDRDDTDFILWHKQMKFARNPRCRLCISHGKPRLKNRLAYAIMGSGQECTVAPFRHTGSFADMIPAERQLCLELVDTALDRLRAHSPSARFRVSGLDDSGTEHCRICITRR